MKKINAIRDNARIVFVTGGLGYKGSYNIRYSNKSRKNMKKTHNLSSS